MSQTTGETAVRTLAEVLNPPAPVDETVPLRTLAEDDQAAAEPEQPTAAEPTEAARELEAHAADVLKRILTEAPTPASITMHTDKWPAPYLAVMYFLDAELSQLRACEELYGGEIRTGDESEVGEVQARNGHRYSELVVTVDGVPVTFWTLIPAEVLDGEPMQAAS
jgi:hypothetical protein